MTKPLRLFVLGVNHRTAPISVREQLAFPTEKLKDALRRLRYYHGIEGGAILSTCNRSEIYISSRSPLFSSDSIKRFITDVHMIDSGDFSACFYGM